MLTTVQVYENNYMSMFVDGTENLTIAVIFLVKMSSNTDLKIINQRTPNECTLKQN